LKNPLWVINPHAAKREFERELREQLRYAISWADVKKNTPSTDLVDFIREVLGE
jgi:hypothetical protein